VTDPVCAGTEKAVRLHGQPFVFTCEWKKPRFYLSGVKAISGKKHTADLTTFKKLSNSRFSFPRFAWEQDEKVEKED